MAYSKRDSSDDVFSGFGFGDQDGIFDENTILVQRTLRSGQSIRYSGNVVILGDVNPGAEVVATGNVIVMGALRGVVHAGANGDEKAVVMAFRLKPTQLRIANHITRPPDNETMLEVDLPEAARIKKGVVTIESVPTGGERQGKAN
ncbi:MAG: septum site-determining protein MinC [Eubacteriales bacterium]